MLKDGLSPMGHSRVPVNDGDWAGREAGGATLAATSTQAGLFAILTSVVAPDLKPALHTV
jgi:hypothetical protein